jgi:hypothetical protein
LSTIVARALFRAIEQSTTFLYSFCASEDAIVQFQWYCDCDRYNETIKCCASEKDLDDSPRERFEWEATGREAASVIR